MITMLRNITFDQLYLSFKNNVRLHTKVVQNSTALHTPVLAEEVINLFNPQNDQIFIDMTFGAGGHSERILSSAENIKLFALDRDPYSHSLANKMANKYGGRLVSLLGKFSDLSSLLSEHDVRKGSIDGILFDVGCSSLQLDDQQRGFSISKNGPLDMRMDAERLGNHQPSASDVLNNLEEDDLVRIFKIYGEEKHAKTVARGIIEAKFMFRPIKTTRELTDLVEGILNKESRLDKLQRPAHTATKIFQALRIFVNNELNELNCGIDLAHQYLKFGGKLIVITFHSLEDRIVKRNLMGIDMNEPGSMNISQKYRNASKWHSQEEMSNLFDRKWTPINKKVIIPSDTETELNPRSRSAKLRAAVKSG